MTINDFVNELKKIGIDINNEQLYQLNRYYELLIEWNEKINLTGIVKKEDVYLKHFYDSLTLNKIIDLKNVESLCDIGTGAGFPGLVLKIVFPNIKITLIDSLNKRINFLNKVIEELNLNNIFTIHARIEEYGKINREKYDVVVARAVASLPIILEYAIPLVKKEGYFIAMKGAKEEINGVDKVITILNIDIEKYLTFVLPFENSNRTLIKFKKVKETSKKYPRNYKDIKNKPL